MHYPISTGQAAKLLATTEPKLADLVRRGHIQPAPPIMVGRRLWALEHVRQAAARLGLLPPHAPEGFVGEQEARQ